MVRLFPGTVRDMTVLVIYNCNQLSQYLKQALEKTVAKSENWETMCDPCDTSNIWLYPTQDWWRTVNEMSNFMYTEHIGNFIFRPVYFMCFLYSYTPCSG